MNTVNIILNKHLTTHINTGVKLGEFDCAIWVADFIQAYKGFDPLEPYRNKYNDWRSIRRQFKQSGVRTFAEAITKQLGTPIGSAVIPRCGDIALYNKACGIVMNCGTGIFLQANQYVLIPISLTTAIYRV